MDIQGLLGQYGALSQPTDEDRKKAMTMGLLSAGLGILAANNSRNFAPAIGAGGLAGLNNYQQTIEAAPRARMQNAIAGMQVAKFGQDMQRQQAIQALQGQFTDPGARMLASIGDVSGAVGRQFPAQQEYNLRPGEQRMRGDQVVASLPKEPEAPKSRTVRRGGMEVTEEWDGKQWKEIGSGPAWNPNPTVKVENYPAPIAALNPATGQVELVQFGSKGSPRPTGFTPPPPTEKPPTEFQGKAETFLGQMSSASQQLANIERGGFDPSTLGSQADTMLASGFTNLAASSKAQQYRQAQDQWSEAFLRVKTGAAATESEVALNRRTFFPQPGDSPNVVQQKAEMRAQAERDVAAQTRQGAPKQAQTMAQMPPAHMHKDRIIEDDKGKRFRSDGMTWRPI